MSNIFAAISLFCFVTLIVLAALVYSRNPKSVVNRVLAATQTVYAAVILVEFGYRNSQNYEQAKFWWSMDFFWPLSHVMLVYFALLFTHNLNVLKKWVTHAIIVAPALTFMGVEIFSDSITGPPIHKYWGWAYTSPNNWLSSTVYVWIVVVIAACFFLTIDYYRKSQDVRKRKQAGILVLVGLAAVGASIVEFILRVFNIEFPSMIGLYWLIPNCFIAYAIWKYDLFALTPITAAENIVSAMADSLLLINNEKKVASANAAAQLLLEYSKEELQGMDADLLFDPLSVKPQWMKDGGADVTLETIKYLDTRLKTKSGRRVPTWLASSPLYDADGYKIGYMMIGRDTTERNRREQELRVFKTHLEKLVEKRTAELAASLEELKKESTELAKVEKERESLEEERTALQQQLYHAQKLESIGRLAGGVAHDFNNLLFVINTYSEGFIHTLSKDDPLMADFLEISQAATRATALTQQLLAFSRKQIATPKVVDPNESIKQLQRMLGRLIGENIRISVVPEINIGRIRIDPGQLDQVLMNLAVNAKDAMPSGGIITVRTNQVTISGSKIRDDEGVVPGAYVVIHFADTGHGMDEATKTKIFDPFFSTKAPGKGTGLGLSTIYGIVKQNGGFVEVDSKLNEGTTFSVYFPKHDPESDESLVSQDISTLKGDETILLVEDDDQVRKLASRLLRHLGYNVIEASGAGEASRIFFEFRNDIDLLFTDVVMPGMSGKQLSKLLGTTKPKLKVLFMSGYNEEITDRLGNLDQSTHFIAKPFSSNALSQKVRQVLDA
jgi:PAS domain S-box-containing protein